MRARRTVLTLGLALAALAATPGGAAAAATDVSVGAGTLFINEAGGPEANDVTVSMVGANMIVSDAGPGTAAGPGCAPSGADVSCPTAGLELIWILLGDLTDRAEIAASVTLESPFGGNFARIEGGPGDDTLIGGPNTTNELWGFSSFGSGPGNDTLTGGSKSDQLVGSEGNDTLTGGDGRNEYFPDLGNDSVTGGTGTDRIHLKPIADGADVFAGGGGRFDELDYDARLGNLSIDADGVADDGETGEGDNVMGDIEEIGTGEGNDTVSLGAAGNSIFDTGGNDDFDGGAGDDSIFGADGDDVVNGGDGDDYVSGGDGADSVSGGAGYDGIGDIEGADGDPDVISGGSATDVIRFAFTEVPLTISLNGVADDGAAGEGDNIGADVEDVIGGERDDTIIGNASDNHLIGGPGEDTLIGGAGVDGLIGGQSGYESGGIGLQQGSSEAVDGADLLDGGAGVDTMRGGTGPDVFRSRDNGGDEIGCGSSIDLLFADAFDDPSVDCDLISRGIGIVSRTVKIDLGKKKGGRPRAAVLPDSARAVLRAACPAIEPGGCEAAFTIRSKQKFKVGKKLKRMTIAKGKRTVAAGKTEAVELKLSEIGSEILDGGPAVASTARARMTDSNGDRVASSRAVRVLAAG